ncbi:hypothetical protein N7448_001929 [Penicillium atrosanguineum]|uniref:Uncharacterized protein n=1 Tax=Penicillium atrosanguineum TaxID=1132637 RepID=A0A9W9L9W1_9EURO|nr:uncharacterized protein N7443_005330 [Penicillium atrosanguineum]KAJ5144537.1 hypothetical protein N7448_001929 [Penicillium atrosanguineum]KAJ5300328.1 hypothetical protein N7443_005330 [Penicillium atrosanguineum]KAJ5310968.1 hypothetical protein N7476_006828 [Penicillium atrosanguineum]
MRAYRKTLPWKDGNEPLSVPINGETAMPSQRTSLGTAWLRSPRVLPPGQPDLKRAGQLGYPSDWFTTADLTLEPALAGSFPCFVWVRSGAVRVDFGRSGVLI